MSFGGPCTHVTWRIAEAGAKGPVKDIGDPMLAQHLYADVSAAGDR